MKEDERNGTHKAETYDPAYTGPNVFAIDTDDGLKSILRMSRGREGDGDEEKEN